MWAAAGNVIKGTRVLDPETPVMKIYMATYLLLQFLFLKNKDLPPDIDPIEPHAETGSFRSEAYRY